MSQNESEWEKELSFRFDTWLKLYPGTPTVGEIEEWWLESVKITLSNREKEIAEEVEEIQTKLHNGHFEAGYKLTNKLLSILKH